MPESAAYARRGFSGAAVLSHLASSITSGQTSITVTDASTWATITVNGPARFVINRGGPTEEEIEAGGVSANTLTSVVRGVGGTTAAAHDPNETIEHVSSVRDYDEANRHIADPTLDNHTQYLPVTGTRPLTLSYGTTISDFPVQIKDAAGNALMSIKRGAAGGATLGSVYIPGGDILNVRNIQGGFAGAGYNLDLGAGSATAGQRGNLSFNYDVGRGVEIWDGSGTGFTSDTVPGGMVAKFNRTVDGTAGEGAIKFYKALSVFATAVIQANGGTAFTVKNAAGTDYFNVNTTSGFVEVVDGGVLRTYSDAYGTVTFQVNGATGAINIYGAVTYAEGKNIGFGTATGTMIGTGFTQKIGFWGAAPVVQQTVTGSRGGNAALASLLTKLALEGLIVDSTTV